MRKKLEITDEESKEFDVLLEKGYENLNDDEKDHFMKIVQKFRLTRNSWNVLPFLEMIRRGRELNSK